MIEPNKIDYETVVCCGAGIGITPFASFLRSLLYLYRANVFLKPKKVSIGIILYVMRTFSSNYRLKFILTSPLVSLSLNKL